MLSEKRSIFLVTLATVSGVFGPFSSPLVFFYIPTLFAHRVILFFSGLWGCFVISFGLSSGVYFCTEYLTLGIKIA